MKAGKEHWGIIILIGHSAVSLWLRRMETLLNHFSAEDTTSRFTNLFVFVLASRASCPACLRACLRACLPWPACALAQASTGRPRTDRLPLPDAYLGRVRGGRRAQGWPTQPLGQVSDQFQFRWTSRVLIPGVSYRAQQDIGELDQSSSWERRGSMLRSGSTPA